MIKLDFFHEDGGRDTRREEVRMKDEEAREIGRISFLI